MCTYNNCIRKIYKESGYCWIHRGQVINNLIQKNISETNIITSDIMSPLSNESFTDHQMVDVELLKQDDRVSEIIVDEEVYINADISDNLIINSKKLVTKSNSNVINNISDETSQHITSYTNMENSQINSQIKLNILEEESKRVHTYKIEDITKKLNISEEEAEQFLLRKENIDKLSLELIKSYFDETTIIEYFLKRFDNYKSYDKVLYYFNGTYWIKGSNQFIINDIDLIYRDLYQLIPIHFDDEDLVKQYKKILFLRKVNNKDTLIKGIIGYVEVNDDLWDLNDDLIGFKNGTYDLKRQKFRVGKKGDYISMVINYDYVKSSKEEVQEVYNFFNKIMPNKDERDLLLLLLSTMLSGRHLEKFIVCTGAGRNSKDTLFTYIIQRMLGPYYYRCNSTAITEQIKGDMNVSISNFNKKRVVITTEPKKNSEIKTHMIKELTGGKDIAMRGLYSSITKVNLNETLFMLCNDKPNLDHSDFAMLKRLIVIPFRSTFESKEFMLENGLMEGENNVYEANEYYKTDQFLDSIKLPLLNLLISNYYLKFKRDGYQIQSVPDSIKKLNESYLEESNEFMNWFNSVYEKTTSKDDILKISDVFRNYCQSDYYDNLTKAEKRANNKTRFNDSVASNVSLRMFYKERFKIQSTNTTMRNILTNYRTRQDSDDFKDEELE